MRHNSASFHQVREGSCLLLADGIEAELAVGDIIYVAEGIDHYLKSLPTATPLESPKTLLLCGYFDFQGLVQSALLNSLPRVQIYRSSEREQDSMVDSLLNQLNREFQSNTPGSRLLIDKFTETLLIALIRSNFGSEGDNQMMCALNDKQIAAALGLLHEEMQKPWTLEKLAQAVGMSRAVFARRFKKLVGQTMFEYLTEVRMNKAKLLLRTTKMLTIDIAAEVGYESDLAFVKTFKKSCEKTPRQYRSHFIDA